MNMMVVCDTPDFCRSEKVSRPMRAANQPLKRNPKSRVGKFENMDPTEAEALLRAMDRAFAEL